MKIEIKYTPESGKWSCIIDGKQITEQSSLWKLFTKMMKYTKSQGI